MAGRTITRLRLLGALVLAVAVLWVDVHRVVAQAQINELFETGRQIAQDLKQAFDQVWNGPFADYLQIPEQLANIFAVAAVVFLLLRMIRQFYDTAVVDWSLLVWPVVIAAILNTPGLTEGIALGTRAVINAVNDTALAQTDLQNIYAQTQGNQAIRAVLGAVRDQCQALPISEQGDCLQAARPNIEAVLQAQQDQFGNQSWLQQWWQSINDFNDLVDQLVADGQDPAQAFAGAIWLSALPTWESILFSVMKDLQQAFQFLLEVSLILTALLLPLALALSITPVGARPIYGWAIGMFSVGLVKLLYTLCAGLAANIMLTANLTDFGLGLGIFMAIFAPIFAFGLATGGGLAVWQGILGSANAGVGAASSVVKR